MKRRTCLGLLGGALALPFVVRTPRSIAQSSSDQATIAALQTQVSLLKTKAALQTQVATLQTQTAGGGAGTPASEQALYQADVKNSGLNQWSGPGWHHVKGMLIFDGSTENSFLSAPYKVPVADYAVEADIQIVGGGDGSLGMFARGDGNGEYVGGYEVFSGYAFLTDSQDTNPPDKTKYGFNLGQDWHTYRLEANGDQLTFSLDGAPVITFTDNRHLTGGVVGLYSQDVQVNVRSFKVIALQSSS